MYCLSMEYQKRVGGLGLFNNIAVVLHIVSVSVFEVAGENNLKSLINLPHTIGYSTHRHERNSNSQL